MLLVLLLLVISMSITTIRLLLGFRTFGPPKQSQEGFPTCVGGHGNVQPFEMFTNFRAVASFNLFRSEQPLMAGSEPWLRSTTLNMHLVGNWGHNSGLKVYSLRLECGRSMSGSPSAWCRQFLKAQCPSQYRSGTCIVEPRGPESLNLRRIHRASRAQGLSLMSRVEGNLTGLRAERTEGLRDLELRANGACLKRALFKLLP